jgi:RHS repeat-associated protein
VHWKYNGTKYYYQHNLQGDIIGLMDIAGTTVVSYTYDSWGKQLSCTGSLANTLGAANPLRYRGYIYDSQTGLYYLQSRYYSPEWGRFISVDGTVGKIGDLLGGNMFAYCSNNPVLFIDPTGMDGDGFWSTWWLGVTIIWKSIFGGDPSVSDAADKASSALTAASIISGSKAAGAASTVLGGVAADAAAYTYLNTTLEAEAKNVLAIGQAKPGGTVKLHEIKFTLINMITQEQYIDLGKAAYGNLQILAYGNNDYGDITKPWDDRTPEQKELLVRNLSVYDGSNWFRICSSGIGAALPGAIITVALQ